MSKRSTLRLAMILGLGLLAFVLWQALAQPRYQGRSAKSWMLQLISFDPKSQQQALRALQTLGPKITPTAVTMLGVTQYSMSDRAYLALLPRLPANIRRRLINHYYPVPPDQVRLDAAQALTIIGPDGRAAIPTLVKLLGVPHQEYLSYQAGCALGKMGKEAVSPLLERLQENTSEVRCRVFFALGAIGPDAEAAAPALAAGLRDPDTPVRLTAEQALDKLGFAANPALLAMLHSQDPADREIAARMFANNLALNDDVVPALIASAPDPVPAVRRQVIESLGHIYPGYGAAIAVFSNALADPDLKVRLAASKALCGAGHRAEPAVPRLVKMLSDPDASARESACRTLVAIGSAAKPALPALNELAEDPEVVVRVAAANAIKLINPAGVAAMPR